MSLPEFPAYAKSLYHPTLNPGDISAEVARHNGNIIFETMQRYVRNELHYMVNSFLPNDTMPEEQQHLVISYFDNDSRKEWLGRQFYLFMGVKVPFEELMFDDGPMFLNWLLRRNGITVNEWGESPILFADNELIVQAGGRKKKLKSRRKLRKTRRRKN
jgi:hypothetical protein